MKFFFSLIAILVSFSNLYSQEVVTLKEALNTAIDNNYDITRLEDDIKIQRLNILTARGNLYPDLRLNGSWTRNNTVSNGGIIFQNGVPISIPSQNSTRDNFNLGMNSNITLFDGFANYEEVTYQEESEASLYIQKQKQEFDLAYNVLNNYFTILKREKIVIVNTENLQTSVAQLEMIKEFMNVGKKTILDVYKQDVQVARNELQLEQSVNEFRKSKVDLLYAMSVDPNRDIAVAEVDVDTEAPITDLKLILDNTSQVNVLTARAVENRYEYKSIQHDIRLNQIRYNIANKNFYFPTVSAFGSYNLSGSEVGKITDQRVLTFGLQLSYPIFQGFELDTRRQLYQINIQQKNVELEQLEHKIKTDIKKAILDLETAYKQVEILNRNIIAAEQDVLLSQENYRLGLGTLLDVQTAQTQLNSIRIDRINAIYDFYLAKKKIDYYTGELKI